MGIIPSEIVPSLIISLICWADNSVITSSLLFLTPDTSVNKSNRSAFSAAAIAPAAVSAFILNVSPPGPYPNGAMTGIVSFSISVLITYGFILDGEPTSPKSLSVCLHSISLASLPDKPTAVGLSGKDAKLIECKQTDKDLGLVGSPSKINPYVISTLIENDTIPVIAMTGIVSFSISVLITYGFILDGEPTSPKSLSVCLHSISLASLPDKPTAVGLSGKDAKLIECKQTDKDLGLVGSPSKINPYVISTLIENDTIPVIAPLGYGPGGETFNINADTAAGAIAAALKADRLLLLTDVSGVKNSNDEVITELSAQQIRDMIKDGTISDGMIPKTETALYALDGGVRAVVILDGRVPNACLLELFTEHGAGSLIRN